MSSYPIHKQYEVSETHTLPILYTCSPDLVVFQEGPEFLEAVQVARVVVSESLLLEVTEEASTKPLLQTVAVEPEETLQAIPGWVGEEVKMGRREGIYRKGGGEGGKMGGEKGRR